MLVTFFVALWLSMASTRAKEAEIELYVKPAEEQLRQAFEGVELAKWSNEENYVPDYTILIHDFQNVVSNQNITRTDPEFGGCGGLHAGFLDCEECKPCEREAAMYDSCGLMTGRSCVVVESIQENVNKTCEKEFLSQSNGDEKCGEMRPVNYPRTDKKGNCTNYECVPVKVGGEKPNCDKISTKPTLEQCPGKFEYHANCTHLFIVEYKGTKCDAQCPVFECEYEDIEEPDCKRHRIENNPGKFFCESLDEGDECGVRKCVPDVDLDENKLVVADGVVKCKDPCHLPVIKKMDSAHKCAEEIVCEKTCPKMNTICPKPDQPSCYTSTKGMDPDECGCAKVACAPPEDSEPCPKLPPEGCPDGMYPTISEQFPCCRKPTTCACESTGVGPNCCTGEGCNKTDGCKTKEECCPRDDEGCLLLGKVCIFTSPTHDVIKSPEECAKSYCPDPHKDVKPNPMCCVGDACDKTEGGCQNMQECCKLDECCKMYNTELKKWDLVSEKCPPMCSSKEDLCTDCYTIKLDASPDPCPKGKCCCRNDLELVVKDCPTGPFGNETTPATAPTPTAPTPTGIVVTGSSPAPGVSTSESTESTTEILPGSPTTPGVTSPKSTGSTGETGQPTPTPTPTRPPTKRIVECKDLRDPYNNHTCCRGGNCCVGSRCCPRGKACCDDNGKLRIIGDHCCKGDGCCAAIGGRRDCCMDHESCCGTGCFKHCRVIKKNGEHGFVDHMAKALTGESECKCRKSVESSETCVKVKSLKPQKCFGLQSEFCYKDCTRQVCLVQRCPNTIEAFVRRHLFA